MKEFSKEIVEIDGKDYTLFLNRKGIVAFEKYSQAEQEKAKKFANIYKDIVKIEQQELTNETNPFEGLEKIDEFDEGFELTKTIYKRLYWIMLYTEHKFSLEEADNIFEKAIKEYGFNQIVELGNQMIGDVNIDQLNDKNVKNLPALKPQK